MRALIIDDEPMARREMRRLLEAHPQIQVVGEADCGETALELLPELKPELLFLDIQMPEMNGFELLHSIPAPLPRVIFCTAYDAHALRAFEVNALDYLLKPVAPARLAQALQRLDTELTDRSAESSEQSLRETDRVLLKGEERSWFIPVKSIYLIQSEGNYTRVYFTEGQVLMLRSLSALEQRLRLPCFFRANRAQMIHLDAIATVEEWFSGGLLITLDSGDKVEVSRRQTAQLRKLRQL
jgi:two-component system, LytTR family, response regulator